MIFSQPDSPKPPLYPSPFLFKSDSLVHLATNPLHRPQLNPDTTNLKSLVNLEDYMRKEYANKYFHKVGKTLSTRFPMMRLIRGDGNCYYRAVILAYLELLIFRGKAYLECFINSLQKGTRSYILENATPAQAQLLNSVIHNLREVTNVLSEDDDLSLTLCVLYYLFIYEDDFDKVSSWALLQGLVLVLRLMAKDFILQNKENCVNGFPLAFAYEMKSRVAVIKIEHNSLEQYAKNEVQKLGEEAEGLTCSLMPIILRVNLSHILIDKNAGVSVLFIKQGVDGYQIFNYKVGENEENKQREIEKKLNFSQEEIYLWITPGHYNLLYERKYWEKIGPKIEKGISKLKLTRGQSKKEQKAKGTKKQEKPDKMVNLHCGHKVNERELVDRLKDEFEIQLSTSNLEEMIFKEGNKRPQCQECKGSLSFNDFQHLGFKMNRKKFTVQEGLWRKKEAREQASTIVPSSVKSDNKSTNPSSTFEQQRTRSQAVKEIKEDEKEPSLQPIQEMKEEITASIRFSGNRLSKGMSEAEKMDEMITRAQTYEVKIRGMSTLLRKDSNYKDTLEGKMKRKTVAFAGMRDQSSYYEDRSLGLENSNQQSGENTNEEGKEKAKPEIIEDRKAETIREQEEDIDEQCNLNDEVEGTIVEHNVPLYSQKRNPSLSFPKRAQLHHLIQNVNRDQMNYAVPRVAINREIEQNEVEEEPCFKSLMCCQCQSTDQYEFVEI